MHSWSIALVAFLAFQCRWAARIDDDPPVDHGPSRAASENILSALDDSSSIGAASAGAEPCGNDAPCPAPCPPCAPCEEVTLGHAETALHASSCSAVARATERIAAAKADAHAPRPEVPFDAADKVSAKEILQAKRLATTIGNADEIFKHNRASPSSGEPTWGLPPNAVQWADKLLKEKNLQPVMKGRDVSVNDFLVHKLPTRFTSVDGLAIRASATADAAKAALTDEVLNQHTYHGILDTEPQFEKAEQAAVEVLGDVALPVIDRLARDTISAITEAEAMKTSRMPRNQEAARAAAANAKVHSSVSKELAKVAAGRILGLSGDCPEACQVASEAMSAAECDLNTGKKAVDPCLSRGDLSSTPSPTRGQLVELLSPRAVKDSEGPPRQDHAPHRSWLRER